MTIAEIVLAVVLVGWAIDSVRAQLEWSWRIPPFTKNMADLVPRYRFFHPRPRGDDFHLLARGRDAAGVWSGWRVIIGPEPRRWWHVLWMPGARATGTVLDFAPRFARDAAALLESSRDAAGPPVVPDAPDAPGVPRAPDGAPPRVFDTKRFPSAKYLACLACAGEATRRDDAAADAVQFLLVVTVAPNASTPGPCVRPLFVSAAHAL